ncbi:hypothetical protein MAR_034782, partial [Mya arenaria]
MLGTSALWVSTPPNLMDFRIHKLIKSVPRVHVVPQALQHQKVVLQALTKLTARLVHQVTIAWPSVQTTQDTAELSGHYCLDGTTADNQYPCPAGTFNNLTGDRCPTGHFCVSNRAVILEHSCPAREPLITDSDQPIQSSCINCPPGYFCNAVIYGAISRSNVGNAASGDCSQCKPGYYCIGEGLTNVTGECKEADNLTSPSGPCGAGHYCTSGALSANPTMLSASQCPAGTVHPIVGDVCPIGYYCPEGMDNPIGCPTGTYQDLTSQDHCK